MREAKIILEEYGIPVNEESLEVAMDAVEKFGSAKNVLIEGLKPEYLYLKKFSKLLAIMDEKQTYDIEAEDVATLLHDINRTILNDSQSKGEDYMKLLASINIRKTFNPTEMQIWVMNYIGGRELISEINKQEPNQLKRRIVAAIEKYKLLENKSEALGIENKNLHGQISAITKRA